MSGTPGVTPTARRLSDGQFGASPSWALALVLLLVGSSLLSSPAIARSDPPPPLRSVVRSEPIARAQQDLGRAFEEAMQSGAEALQSGNASAAVAAFERAVALQPRHPIALALLGSALLAAERAEEALEPLGRATDSWRSRTWGSRVCRLAGLQRRLKRSRPRSD